jgi:hypothetical protein
MMRMHEGWQEIADTIIDTNEISRFLNGYFQSTRTEEEYGRGYLWNLLENYPEYSVQINSLMVMAGIGSYVTHWFLEKGGAICR